MRSRFRWEWRLAALWATGLFGLVYTVDLLLHQGALDAVVDGWPGVASRWCAVLVCWLAA